MVRNHQHEWRPLDDQQPIFEDGAVVFYEECNFVEVHGSYHSERLDEVFYDEGEQCDETRTIRLDLVRFEGEVEKEFEDNVNGYIIHHSDEIEDEIETALLKIEYAMRENKGEVLEIDPHDRVIVEYEGIRAVYER